MLITYIDPPLSRTMENRKPAEKASTQSKFHGDMFPACSRPKKADTITIPTLSLGMAQCIVYPKRLSA